MLNYKYLLTTCYSHLPVFPNILVAHIESNFVLQKSFDKTIISKLKIRNNIVKKLSGTSWEQLLKLWGSHHKGGFIIWFDGRNKCSEGWQITNWKNASTYKDIWGPILKFKIQAMSQYFKFFNFKSLKGLNLIFYTLSNTAFMSTL